MRIKEVASVEKVGRRDRTIVSTRSFQHGGRGEQPLLPIPVTARHSERLDGIRNLNLEEETESDLDSERLPKP